MAPAVSADQPEVEHGLTRRLPAIYLLCALIVTLLLAVLTPPFFVPDEASHSLRALQLAHGHVMAQPSAMGAGGETDRNAYAAMARMTAVEAALAQRFPIARSRPDGRVSRGDLEAVQRLAWAQAEQFYPFPNTAVYPPALYLPQAAGWAIALHLRTTIFHGLLLARICAALASVLVGWLALRFSVCSRAQLFVVLLLPTCLSLNASTSQDAVLFGCAALAAACLSRPLRQRRQFRIGELLATAVLLTACIGARVPYMPLMLLLFLPALNAPAVAKKSLLAPAAAALAGGLLVAGWQAEVKPLGVLTGAGADIGRQWAFLHAHPAYGALVLTKSTLLGSSLTVLKGLAWLGTNDAGPPLPVYGLLVCAILIIVLLSTGGCLHTWRARALLLGAAVAAAAAMSLAEYLIWSAPGARAVFLVCNRAIICRCLPCLRWDCRRDPSSSSGPQSGRRVLAAAYVALLCCVVSTAGACGAPLLCRRAAGRPAGKPRADHARSRRSGAREPCAL